MTDALLIHSGADTGGNCWGLTQGFRRHPQPGLTVRSAIRGTNYINYPHDLPWADHRQAWDNADVVHLQNNTSTLQRAQLNPAGKRVVITYHGTGFRENPDPYLTKLRNLDGLAAVSTLDLHLLRPLDTTWLPASYDTDWLATLRRPQQDGRIRIGHAPTNRGVKDTATFLQACEGLPVTVVLIEKRSWADTLTRKGACDIFYDQLALGYGNNAIEAWGMGIPVICGAADTTLTEYHRRFGDLPFVQARKRTLRAAIERLLDPEERDTWGQRGREHARRWHDRYPVEVAAALYEGRQPPQA